MKKNTQVTHAANLGFETNLWAAASDALEARHAELDAQIAHGNAFHNDPHPELKADYVLANPPFNDNDWRGKLLKDDPRWAYGTPPAGNGFSNATSVHQRQAA